MSAKIKIIGVEAINKMQEAGATIIEQTITIPPVEEWSNIEIVGSIFHSPDGLPSLAEFPTWDRDDFHKTADWLVEKNITFTVG